MDKKELQALVQKSPTGPGVYRWKDRDGTVLYVGKAKNLKNRLKSYTGKIDPKQGPWKKSLCEQIEDLEITTTVTELEALILEINLIKELKPKYNVLMKDDKNYVYVCITKETFPRVSIVRQKEEKHAKYLGPFLQKYRLEKMMDLLNSIKPFQATGKALDILNRDPEAEVPASLDQQIGRCCLSGRDRISNDEYKRRIGLLERVLKGDTKELEQCAKEEMQKAAENRKFERAALCRDALSMLVQLNEQQAVATGKSENIDTFGISQLQGKVHVVILQERGGKIVEEQSIALKGDGESHSEILSQVIAQYYAAQTEFPESILVPVELSDTQTLEEWLSEKRGTRVNLAVPERGRKAQLLSMAKRNAEEKQRKQLAAWEAQMEDAKEGLETLKNTLNIEVIPKRIECYDISHSAGEHTVGSMVVAQNGKVNSRDYRSFSIQSLQSGEIDDYAALTEVLSRRLRHLKEGITGALEHFETQGITFGKARKAEQAAIEEIHAAHKESMSQKNIDYRDYFLARKEDTIIGFGRLVTNMKEKITELKSVWVDEEFRGEKIGQLLSKLLLKKQKEGKVYITTSPDLQEYYSALGFKPVRTPPDFLAKQMEKIASKPHLPSGLIMVYIVKDHKEDSSLSKKPDLLVIDGGKGQLSTIAKVLKDMHLSIPVVGLAKREEEIFRSGYKESIILPDGDPGKTLLMRLRDEAHRFANKGRKTKIQNTETHSALDDIPGIGPTTRKELLKKFGSVKRVMEASDEELREILSAAQISSLRS